MKTIAPKLLVLGSLCLCLAGCGGAPEQYYRLSAAGAVPVHSSGLAVGVGPVTLPGYIDRTELVFQNGSNEFQVPAKAHWAGSLQENVTRVLADDLARRLGSGAVAAHPWPANLKLRYQVTVDVRQFHAVSGGDAILDASWRVEDPASREVLRRRNASFHTKIAGDGYGPVVRAESELLDELAQAIRASL